MKQVIILGAGGTISYFYPHVVRYFNSQQSNDTVKITLLDGDVVEERNLLRQGFYPCDLDKVKSIALKERFEVMAKPSLELVAHQQFVNSIQSLVMHVDENADSILLVSGVDNNMARLRMHLAAYAINDMGKQVEIIDSGNTEWFGQVLISRFMRNGSTFLSGLYEEARQGGIEAVRNFALKPNRGSHKITSIFTPDDAWITRLTRGEHELGCQDNVVARPQNIGTNMLAGATLLQALHLVMRGQLETGILKFDAKQNSVTPVATPAIEDGYEQRVQSILEYLQSDEGFDAVFGATMRNGLRVRAEVADTVVPQMATTTEEIFTEELPQVELEELDSHPQPVVQPVIREATRPMPVRRRATPVARTPRMATQIRSVSATALAVLEELDNDINEGNGFLDDILNDL